MVNTSQDSTACEFGLENSREREGGGYCTYMYMYMYNREGLDCFGMCYHGN